MSSWRPSELQDRSRSDSDLLDESIEFKQQEWVDYRFASEDESSDEPSDKQRKKDKASPEPQKLLRNSLLVPPVLLSTHEPVSLDLFQYKSAVAQIKEDEQYWEAFMRYSPFMRETVAPAAGRAARTSVASRARGEKTPKKRFRSTSC